MWHPMAGNLHILHSFYNTHARASLLYYIAIGSTDQFPFEIHFSSASNFKGASEKFKKVLFLKKEKAKTYK